MVEVGGVEVRGEDVVESDFEESVGSEDGWICRDRELLQLG